MNQFVLGNIIRNLPVQLCLSQTIKTTIFSYLLCFLFYKIGNERAEQVLSGGGRDQIMYTHVSKCKIGTLCVGVLVGGGW
jgi:hypothetical protein